MRSTIVALGIVATVFFGFVFIQAMGMGGWEPDKSSTYAVRARAVYGQLRPGMTRRQITAIFHADAAMHPLDDTIEHTSNGFWGHGVPTWPDELDLYIFESRPHFWDSFDTTWTIRAAFDKQGRLSHRRLQIDPAGGP